MQNDTALEEINILIRLDMFAAHTLLLPSSSVKSIWRCLLFPFGFNPAVADRRPKVWGICCASSDVVFTKPNRAGGVLSEPLEMGGLGG